MNRYEKAASTVALLWIMVVTLAVVLVETTLSDRARLHRIEATIDSIIDSDPEAP